MRGPAPAPLLVAAALVGVEGLLLVGYGGLELASLSRGRLTMGATTAAFFLAYGAGLVACAWALRGGRSWARGPVILAQLIQLGLAWNLRQDPTSLLAVGLAVVALVVVVGLLHPASIRALEGDPA